MKLDQKSKAGGLLLGMIAATLALEGGYVFDKDDPGGETNMGVTKKVAIQHGYTGPMKTLPKEVAYSIYYKGYIQAPGYEPLVLINAPVVEELFDTNVNMGPYRPSSWFQQSINQLCGTQLVVDGKVGRGTIATFSTCQAKLGAASLCLSMLDSLDTKQRAEYDRLVRVNPKLKKFHKGWVNNRIGNVPRAHCKIRFN